jgi:hypothetical protein
VSYDVILMGFRLNSGEPPAQVLERVLGLDAAKAKLATQRFPVILTRTTAEKAERIAQVLRDAGASVELRENRDAQVSQAAAQPPAAPPPPPGAARPLPDLPPVPKLAPPPPLGAALGGAPGLKPASMGQHEPSGALAGAQPVPASTLAAPLPTAAPASVLSASPANDQGLLGAGASRGTAYQLGDLDLGAAAPSPKPAAAPPPAELEASLPPSPAASETAASAAPRAAPAASGESGFGGEGMQSFGDGFDDDLNQAAPALELDRDAAWLKKQKAAPTPEKKPAPAVEPAREDDAPRPSPRPPKPHQPYVLPPPPPLYKRLWIAFEDFLIAARPVVINVVVLAVLTLVCALAVAFARNPDATFELVGLASPPPVGKGLQIPVVEARTVADSADDPSLHPLLRAAPPELVVDVQHLLQERVRTAHVVTVTWPEQSKLDLKSLDCMLVEQAASDPKGTKLIADVHTLVRTGHALVMPDIVRAQLATEELRLRKELHRPKARFVELCLAL